MKIAKTQKKLKKTFPLKFRDNLYENNSSWQQKVISIHNHCLSEQEAELLSLSFQVNKKDRIKFSQYLVGELKFLLGFFELYLKNRVYYFNLSKNKYYAFESMDEYISICRKGLREKKSVALVIPKKKQIMWIAQDLNISLFAPKIDIGTLKIFEEKGLFTLE